MGSKSVKMTPHLVQSAKSVLNPYPPSGGMKCGTTAADGDADRKRRAACFSSFFSLLFYFEDKHLTERKSLLSGLYDLFLTNKESVMSMSKLSSSFLNVPEERQAKQDVDWSKVPRQLDGKTCIRREHPDCEYHFTALQRYFYLRKKIGEAWDSLQFVVAARLLSKAKSERCDKHWTQDCYLCSTSSDLDRDITKYRKIIRNSWFSLTELLIEAGIIDRVIALPKLSSPVDDAWKQPLSRLFDQSEMRSVQDTPKRSLTGWKDGRDNDRLLIAVLKQKIAAMPD